MSDDGLFRDPNKETKLRWQDDKETLGSASNSDPPPWKVGDQLNDFILEELLGSGSSGVVYRALDAKTKRRCALKLLKHGSPDDLLRNKLGFRRMMSVEHPNLLRVDRIYQLGSHIALSMEEVDGVTLDKAIKEFQNLDSRSAYEKLLKLMRDFASGLAMMHANGYIHRDIKPQNLMVDRAGNGRVIDYGLVEAYDLGDSMSGVRGFLLGTPHYFAPEVICSQRYLPAGDIFSLGIVMLDALRWVQRSLKASTSSEEVASLDHLEVERSETDELYDAERIVEAIEDLSESIPSTIREACREMLDRNPAQRPTALQLSRLGAGQATKQVAWPHEEPIVGREREQREIFSWIDGVFDGDIGRLHLTGPSGIGKSRLVEAVIGYVASKKWGQLFNARCRIREDQPLQAFDQLCDAITNRYMQGDRERLEMDPVSVGILQSVFPVLKNILACSMQMAPACATSERLDALEAAARMSEKLRLVGPLFLIIDDSQWADRDSLNVLDRLQSAAGGEGLGIITVSRDSEDPQLVPAGKYIALQPLGVEDSVKILANAAKRWMVDVSQPVLRELAEATHGSPFRLRELADEFRPGGALADLDRGEDSAVDDLGQIDRLWQKRAERMSDEAKLVLPFVVTAGGRVSTQQLGELTGLADSVDAAVSELARGRLITDEATGGDCIAIFHDHVADELVKTLSARVIRRAHHAWASLLVRHDNPERLAARIAGHFIAAGQPGRAVAHAILAAEDAERHVAKSEAARWYAQVVAHVDGEEKLIQLRNAARCYYEADFPLKAAECYQHLAQLVDDQERIECRLLATTLLIRSGRFKQVRDQLCELAKTLGLPRPRSLIRSRLALSANRLRLAIFRKDALPAVEHQRVEAGRKTDGNHSPAGEAAQIDRQQQQIRLCLLLLRPMSMFDHRYAADLNVAAALLSQKHGDAAQRVHVAVSQAVSHCYDAGRRRIHGETALEALKPQVARLNSPQASGDLWAGFACSHALACRWHQVSLAVQSSIEHYRAASDSIGFELAYTQSLDLWANWHLGRWKAMRKLSNAMFDDATRRSDLFQQILTTSGYGGAAWLVRNKTDELKRIRADNAKSDCNPNQVQLVQVFDWMTSIQALLYQGEYAEAWTVYQSMEPDLRKAPYSRMQLIRVSHRALGALAALHNLHADDSETWIPRIQVLTRRLRLEQNSYARVLANLYQGLLLHHLAKPRKSSDAVDRARRLLFDARDVARERRLRPYQLAAEDALAEMHTGASLQLLADRMESQNVVRPDQLQRLYTLPGK